MHLRQASRALAPVCGHLRGVLGAAGGVAELVDVRVVQAALAIPARSRCAFSLRRGALPLR